MADCASMSDWERFKVMLPACSSMVIMPAKVAASSESTVRTVKTANSATPRGWTDDIFSI